MRRSDTTESRPERETRDDRTGARDDRDRGKPRANRRRFLKLSAATVGAVGTVGMGSASAVAVQDGDGGPPNPDDWEIAFEDTFEDGSLDDSSWTVGWGWGDESTTSNASISSENVTVDENTLQLAGTHDGEEMQTGGVHTRENVEFGPGSYVEARVRFPDRVGFHPAFWAQPTSNAWPPELDVVEITQDGSGSDDVTTSRHFLHYSVSTEPGDNSTHERVSQFYEPGGNLTENFHVYGAEWLDDRIAYYVDGEEVASWTDSTILESFRRGAPFYLKFTMNVNVDSDLNDYLGQADLSESWGESMDVDWVRLWDQ